MRENLEAVKHLKTSIHPVDKGMDAQLYREEMIIDKCNLKSLF